MNDKGIDPNDRMRSAFEYRMTCERFYHMEAKHWHHVEYQGPMLRKSEFSEWLDNTVGERNYLRYLPKGEPEVLVFRNKSDAVYCKLRWNIG